MKTTTIKVKIKDLVKQYSDKGFDGVSAYGGKLDIRPPYQREFVYDAAKEIDIISKYKKLIKDAKE